MIRSSTLPMSRYDTETSEAEKGGVGSDRIDRRQKRTLGIGNWRRGGRICRLSPDHTSFPG